MKKLIKKLLSISLLSTSLVSNVHYVHAQEQTNCTQLTGTNIDTQIYQNNTDVCWSNPVQSFLEKTSNGRMRVISDESVDGYNVSEDDSDIVSGQTNTEEDNAKEVDKIALNSVIEETNTLKEVDYTVESWYDFEEALEAAKDVAADEGATQEEVDAAVDSLKTSVEALVIKLAELLEQPEEVDRSKMFDLIYFVKRLNETAFIEETWENLMEVMSYAENVRNDDTTSQEEIDMAFAKLKTAIGNLRYVPTITVKELPEIAPRPNVKEVAPGKFYLSWDASARADKYVVMVLYSVHEQEVTYIKDVKDTSLYIDDLTADALWGFRIMAGNEVGYADFSEMVTVFATPKTPENVKVHQDNYKDVTLTWDEVKGCPSYEIYRKSYKEDSEFTLVGTTKENSFTSKNLKTGKTYSYYVVGKGSLDYIVSQPSEVVSIATQLEGKPKLSLEKVSKTKFKLNWTKVKGATRYIVYRKRNEDKYKKVLTLGEKVFEYTTSEMPKGDYTFIVKAARYDSIDRVMSAGSNAVRGTSTYSKPVITLKAGTKQIKVSWGKVEGVTNYEVYRSTSKSGTYKKVKTTTETSFTSKSLKSGKTYYFKVKGYKVYKKDEKSKEKIYTSYSDVKSVKAK